MSGRRTNNPATPLCSFAFADGRHCTLPAHPDYDGLCYSHGTLDPRASREDNLRRELEPLASGRSSVKARRRGLRALSRALEAGRLSPGQATTLIRVSGLVEQSGRFADEESFTRQSGRSWERLRQLVDDLDSQREGNANS